MKHFHKTRRMMAVLLMIALLLSAMPAAVAESFSAFVTAGSMAVYADESLSEKIGTLEKYAVVTVKDYSGGVARISANGRTGYAKISAMERVDKVAVEATVNTSTKVYREPSTGSESTGLGKGTLVNVIGVNGKWALIERNGVGGYTYVQYLTKKGSAPQATAAPTAKPTATPTAKPTAAATPEVDLSKAIPGIVTADSVKVYKTASTSSTVLGSLGKGTELNVLKTNGSWAMVERKGQIGYCKVSALTPKSQYNTPAPTAVPTVKPTATPAATPEIDLSKAIPGIVTADSVKVYKTASTSSTVLGTLGKGTELNVVKVNGSWAMVERKGQIGYCKVSALTPKSQYNTPAPTAVPTATPTAKPEATPEIDLSKVIPGIVTDASVKVYKTASTSSTVLGTLGKGTELNVVKVNGSWAMVERKGQIGYCKVSALTPKSQYNTPTPSPVATAAATPGIDLSKAIPGVVSAASVKVYKTASTSSAVLGTLGKGTELNVLNVSGSWAMVERKGAIGYCKVSALTPKSQYNTPAPTATPTVQPTATPNLKDAIPGVVTASSVMVYKEPSSSSAKLGSIGKGTEVNVIRISGSWAQVERNGAFGWCSASALTPKSQMATPVPSEKLDKPVDAVVSASTMKVYKEASTSSEVLGTLKKNTEITVTALTTDGVWAQIKRGSNVGWCKLASLKVVEKDPLEGFTKANFGATVVTTDAKFYAIDTNDDGVKIAFGTDVTVGAYSKEQAYVKYGSKYGFIAVSALSRSEYAALSKGSTGTAVSTLEKALLAGGYFDAKPDGTYDSATEAAVKRFQSACGVSASGAASQSLQRMLYSGNGPSSSLLSSTLSKGSSGENVSRIQMRLYYLGYLSKTGSVDGDYGATTVSAVSLFQAANKLSQTGTADSATLRKLYSTSAAALPSGKTPADMTVIVNPTTGSQKNNSTTISSTLASVTTKYNSSMSAAEKLEYVIYVGQNQLGKPYVYGANGTSSYDCTGFTVYCFKQVGVSLPRTAQNQGYNTKYERITSTSKLKRGDLVYFDTISDSDLSDHAGIYLGAGWFIHASSGQGKVVISTLSSGYYNRVFSWGHRPLG